MHMVAYHAVMIHGRTGINDTIVSDHGPGINDRPRANRNALAQAHGTSHSGTRVDNIYWHTTARYKLPENPLTNVVPPHGDQKPELPQIEPFVCSRGNHPDTQQLIYFGLVIHNQRHRDVRAQRCIQDDFAVSAGTKKNHRRHVRLALNRVRAEVTRLKEIRASTRSLLQFWNNVM
jgi:hypothetical protein